MKDTTKTTADIESIDELATLAAKSVVDHLEDMYDGEFLVRHQDYTKDPKAEAEKMVRQFAKLLYPWFSIMHTQGACTGLARAKNIIEEATQ